MSPLDELKSQLDREIEKKNESLTKLLGRMEAAAEGAAEVVASYHADIPELVLDFIGGGKRLQTRRRLMQDAEYLVQEIAIAQDHVRAQKLTYPDIQQLVGKLGGKFSEYRRAIPEDGDWWIRYRQQLLGEMESPCQSLRLVAKEHGIALDVVIAVATV